MQAAVAEAQAEGAVGALVNNAGYSSRGALETLPMDVGAPPVRDQRLRLAAAHPARAARDARARARARSSTSARWAAGSTFPGGGAYHATKYAVEALSDALRMEVRGFGIDVVCIEPGLIRTEFGETAAGGVGDDERPVRRVQPRRGQADPRGLRRARWPASAAARRPSPRRSDGARRADRRADARPASPPPPASSWACAALLPDRAWDRVVMGNFTTPR